MQTTSNIGQIDQSDIRKMEKTARIMGLGLPLDKSEANLEMTKRMDFQFGRLVQGNDSVAVYYSRLKDQLKYQFLRGLTPENQICVRMFGLEHTLDEMEEMFEQKKEKETKLITTIKDYICHPGDANIYTGSDLMNLTVKLAKRLGFKISPINANPEQ